MIFTFDSMSIFAKVILTLSKVILTFEKLKITFPNNNKLSFQFEKKAVWKWFFDNFNTSVF